MPASRDSLKDSSEYRRLVEVFRSQGSVWWEGGLAPEAQFFFLHHEDEVSRLTSCSPGLLGEVRYPTEVIDRLSTLVSEAASEAGNWEMIDMEEDGWVQVSLAACLLLEAQLRSQPPG